MVINDNNNFAPSLFQSLCEFLGDCFGPWYFFSGAALPHKNTLVQNNHLRFHTMTSIKIMRSYYCLNIRTASMKHHHAHGAKKKTTNKRQKQKQNKTKKSKLFLYVYGNERLWLKLWARGDRNCAILLRGAAEGPLVLTMFNPETRMKAVGLYICFI